MWLKVSQNFVVVIIWKVVHSFNCIRIKKEIWKRGHLNYWNILFQLRFYILVGRSGCGAVNSMLTKQYKNCWSDPWLLQSFRWDCKRRSCLHDPVTLNSNHHCLVNKNLGYFLCLWSSTWLGILQHPNLPLATGSCLFRPPCPGTVWKG